MMKETGSGCYRIQGERVVSVFFAVVAVVVLALSPDFVTLSSAFTLAPIGTTTKTTSQSMGIANRICKISSPSSSSSLFAVLEEFEENDEKKKKDDDDKKKRASSSSSSPASFLPEEEYVSGGGSDIDWDSEWKKVVREQQTGAPVERPGKDFYKSDAEIAAIRAANKAQQRVFETANKLPVMPSWETLRSDWKFWIGIIAVISILTAVLTAPPSYTSMSPPPVTGQDSYFI